MTPEVLLVEDSEDDVLFVRRAFRGVGREVRLRVAPDGEAALAALEAERPPDLVLLDLKLPRLGGLEVLRWLRARPGGAFVPVVVLTASHEPGDVRGAYALGANSYLVKPVNAGALREVVVALAEYWLRHNVRPPEE